MNDIIFSLFVSFIWIFPTICFHSLCVLLSVLALATPALTQQCSLVGDTMQCAALGLNSVPTLDPASVYIELQENDIPSISQADFLGLAEVRKLDLSGNAIASVPAFCFSGMPKLAWMNLRNNQISFIDEQAFWDIPQLRGLDLAFNLIVDFMPGHLAEVPDLINLILGVNQINHLPVSLFQEVPMLKLLFLHRNPIGALDKGVFDNLHDLETLSLWKTEISTLPDGLFDDQISLNNLDLRGNDLMTLDEALLQNVSFAPLVLELGDNPLDFCSILWLKQKETDGAVIWNKSPPECVTGSDWADVNAEDCQGNQTLSTFLPKIFFLLNPIEHKCQSGACRNV